MQAQLRTVMEANIKHVLGDDTLAASAAHCLVVYLHRLGGTSLPPDSATAFAVSAGAPIPELDSELFIRLRNCSGHAHRALHGSLPQERLRAWMR